MTLKILVSIVFLSSFSYIYSQDVKPTIFEKAFLGNHSKIDSLIFYDFSVKPIGRIRIKSGKIVGHELKSIKNKSEFIEKFPIGKFPVQVAVVKDFDEEFVAYCRILFSDESVVKWQKAIIQFPSGISNSDSTIGDCPLSDGSNIGVFIDSVFMKKMKPLKIGLKSNELAGVKNSLRCSMILFSGITRDCFSSYIGFDANGKICRLLADTGRIMIPESMY